MSYIEFLIQGVSFYRLLVDAVAREVVPPDTSILKLELEKTKAGDNSTIDVVNLTNKERISRTIRSSRTENL